MFPESEETDRLAAEVLDPDWKPPRKPWWWMSTEFCLMSVLALHCVQIWLPFIEDHTVHYEAKSVQHHQPSPSYTIDPHINDGYYITGDTGDVQLSTDAANTIQISGDPATTYTTRFTIKPDGTVEVPSYQTPNIHMRKGDLFTIDDPELVHKVIPDCAGSGRLNYDTKTRTFSCN